MYAGSSGSNYGVNKNSPGNGNGKWQGLWPSVGHAKNARLINTRAGGDNRNVVFCMNQLGGVGRISNMFATTADGVKDCGCILSSDLKEALHKLGDYALSQNKQLCLIGETETISHDVPGHSGSFDTTFHNLQLYVKRINDLKLKFAVTGPNDVQQHVVAMVTPPDAKVLKEHGFGFPVSALCNKIIAYGFNCKLFSPRFTFNDSSITFNFGISGDGDLGWQDVYATYAGYGVTITATQPFGPGPCFTNLDKIRVSSGYDSGPDNEGYALSSESLAKSDGNKLHICSVVKGNIPNFNFPPTADAVYVHVPRGSIDDDFFKRLKCNNAVGQAALAFSFNFTDAAGAGPKATCGFDYPNNYRNAICDL